jgi:hypothetical protein
MVMLTQSRSRYISSTSGCGPLAELRGAKKGLQYALLPRPLAVTTASLVYRRLCASSHCRVYNQQLGS